MLLLLTWEAIFVYQEALRIGCPVLDRHLTYRISQVEGAEVIATVFEIDGTDTNFPACKSLGGIQKQISML